jgi:PAS domain-containing protein
MAARARVCALCGLGVVVTAGADVAPEPGDAFLIVDGRLRVGALSEAAERLLGVEEPLAVHRLLSDFLEPADVEVVPQEALMQAVIDAAGGGLGSRRVFVRPKGEYGVRYAARIGPCWPPAGALIVLAADLA